MKKSSWKNAIFVKDSILYWFNKPSFQYLEKVIIPSKDIFSVLDGNVKARYKSRIVHGFIRGYRKDDTQIVQLIKLL